MILLVSLRFSGFSDNPAHINISPGVQCQLWGNVVVTLAGNINNQGTLGGTGTSKVIFHGTTPEAIGGTGSTQFQNAVLNNKSVTANSYLTGNIRINDTLRLDTGNINLKNYNLTIGPLGNIIGSSGTTVGPFGINAMIIADADGQTGQLMKSYAANKATNFKFPIGDTTGTYDYSPVTLNFTQNSADRRIGVNVTNQKNINGTNVTNYLNRYWSFTDSLGTGTYAYNATFSYSTNLPTDIVGTYNALCMFWWNGQWNSLNTSHAGAPTYGIGTLGLANETTATLGGSEFTGRVCSCAPPVIPPDEPVAVKATCSPMSTSFNISGTTGADSYQWQTSQDGNAWNPITNAGGGSNPTYSGFTSSQLNISNATQTGNQYRCLAINCFGSNQIPSNAVTLEVNTKPVISFITESKVKCSRDSVKFKVTPTGTTPYSYLWTGPNISANNTNFSYTIGIISKQDTGKFFSKVSNMCGSSTASTLLALSNPPSILDTIQNEAACTGTKISFTYKTSGTYLKYQWTKNGSSITGGYNAIYTINSLKTSDAGTYSCVVSNICNTKTSKPFTLTVKQLGGISDLPLTLTKNPGDNVQFSPTITGTSPFSYKWGKHNTLINGATLPSLTKSITDCNDAGVYTIIISNTCGTSTSWVATINVNSCNTVSGLVTYDNAAKTPISKTIVYLKNSSNVQIDDAMTDITGLYTFFNVPNGIYHLAFGKSGMAWGGSNPVDALTINQYYIDLITTFGGDNAERKIAANVNGDANIDPLDALTINRRFMKIINHFNIQDWLYDSPASINVSGGSVPSQNVKAICAGDVNGSYPR